MRYETEEDIIREEDYIRQHLDKFPENHFINELNSLSIDFIREMTKYIDIKRILWNARPWNVEETIEEHMNYWHSHLKEFWKDILNDTEYARKHCIPINIKSLKINQI